MYFQNADLIMIIIDGWFIYLKFLNEESIVYNECFVYNLRAEN